MLPISVVLIHLLLVPIHQKREKWKKKKKQKQRKRAGANEVEKVQIIKWLW